MQTKWRRNAIFTFIEAAIFFPILLLLGIVVDRFVSAGPVLVAWWAESALCAAAGVILRPLPWPRWLMVMIGTVIAFAATLLTFGASSVALAVVCPLGGAVFLRALLLDADTYTNRSVMYWIGLLVHFIGYLLFRYHHWFQPYLSWVVVSGVLSLLICVLMTNRESLLAESFSKGDARKVSRQTKRINRSMLFVLLLILAFAVFYGPIIEAFQAMFYKLVQWLSALLERGESSPPPPEPPPPGSNEMQLPPAEENDGWFKRLSDILFQLVVYVVYVALAAGALFLLYVGIKQLSRLLRRISAWLADRFEGRAKMGATQGFVDEEVQLLNLRHLGREYLDKLRDLGARIRREPPPRDNKEKLRRIYRDYVREAVKAGYTFKPHLTPKETLKDIGAWRKRNQRAGMSHGLGGLYYKARYSPAHISDEEMKEIERK